ncbi:MAG TPA: hypothetical protein VHX38_00970 [Pseudonocardiaceae bacterium]|jgi:hypothetical protein|nr:hypothetical protein [Pseudonocardiaceae bacterium]
MPKVEKTWTLSGAYGDWSLTLKIEQGDPDHSVLADPDQVWTETGFQRLADHFHDLMDYRELVLDTDTDEQRKIAEYQRRMAAAEELAEVAAEG